MKHVNKIGVLFFCFLTSLVFSQNSEKLKKEQERLDKKISNTKSLLDKTQNQSKNSLSQLQLVEKQIEYRESLLSNFNHQIRGSELKLQERSQQVVVLNQRIEKMKQQYKRMLIYAYKKRNRVGKVMYIFSATNYFEAVRRKRYLEKIAELQQKQFLIIRQNERLLKHEMQLIEQDKRQKIVLVTEKEKEKEKIEVDKREKELLYQKLKKEEQYLATQLSNDEKKKAVLKQKIANAIQKEIAAAEVKRKKAEEAARLKAEKNKTTTTASNTSTNTSKEVKAPAKKELSFEEAKDYKLNANFETNKGKLPWPVASGAITENFGKNPHPTLENVFTNNNGVDITTQKNGDVRAIFDGEVTSIVNIPGAGKLVIIKHGNYRSVYCNLQETSVSIGSKVSTKQKIGSLLVKEGESLSTVHFELHVVNGSSVQVLNPNGWIAR